MFRFVVTALLLAPIAFGTGCASKNTQRDPRLEHDDIPASLQRAQELELLALDKVAAGNRRRHTGKRRELFTQAINMLREARLLYEEELLKDGGKATPERQRNIEAEIKRISDTIDELHKDRPAQ